MEIHLDQADAGDAIGFDAFDAIDRGRIGALADDDDATLHLLGRQSGVVPADENDRDVDLGEKVDHHTRHRQAPEQEHQ